MALLEVDLVAADGRIWSGQATYVSAPASEGDLGVLIGHSPVLSVLRRGEVRVTPPQGAQLRWTVNGGYLSVDSDQVTVVVDSAERSASPATR